MYSIKAAFRSQVRSAVWTTIIQLFHTVCYLLCTGLHQVACQNFNKENAFRCGVVWSTLQFFHQTCPIHSQLRLLILSQCILDGFLETDK